MKLHIIHTGNFKLDGGAMFGVVPKSIWNKSNPADENNLCTWAMRCLLIEEDQRLVLVDDGIGDKQNEKFFSHYHLHGNQSLNGSLQELGFHPDDITDVFLTHLHFDHCGGSIVRRGDKLEPAFKNATYWSNEYHWQWATQPNEREKASFLAENILPIRQSGQLKFIGIDHQPGSLISTPSGILDGLSVFTVNGHTDAMMLPKIRYKDRTLVFMADLLPSAGHLPLPYVMAYDMFPLTTLSEKKAFLQEAAEQHYVLFFEHDPVIECCTVHATEKGIRMKEHFRLEDI